MDSLLWNTGTPIRNERRTTLDGSERLEDLVVSKQFSYPQIHWDIERNLERVK